jgi:uncharacterized protein YbaA (DUF1428 family)
MYQSIFLYRVPKENVDAFVQIQREVAEIYRREGALENMTFVASNLEAQYGFLAIDSAFPLAEQEVVLVELATYRDRAHQNEVAKKLATDERSIKLYQKLLTILDRKRQVYGEFEQVV